MLYKSFLNFIIFHPFDLIYKLYKYIPAHSSEIQSEKKNKIIKSQQKIKNGYLSKTQIFFTKFILYKNIILKDR